MLLFILCFSVSSIAIESAPFLYLVRDRLVNETIAHKIVKQPNVNGYIGGSFFLMANESDYMLLANETDKLITQ